LSFGYHIASILETRLSSPSFLKPLYRHLLSVIAVLTYAATFLAYFLLADKFRHQATAALLFSFPGTLTRYILSVTLNPRLKGLPVGTLAANSLGTALLATFHVLQSTIPPPSMNTCSILQGLIDGYCGCLTTISTFAFEVHTLRDWKAFRYVVVSWLMGQGLMLVILGPSIWTGRVSEQVTCKFTKA
jgi:CrcB protein